MRPGIPAVVILAAALAAMPSRGAAQEPVASFDQLNTRIEVGDTVWVTDAQGRDIRGRIQRLAADALTLEGFGTLDAREVRLVRHREHDSLKNGTLIGLGIGGGLALAWCIGAAIDDSGSVSARVECTEGSVVFGGLGTFLGLVVDAAIPGKMRVAYRAPGSPGASSSGRPSIGLLVTPRAKGVAVSIAF